MLGKFGKGLIEIPLRFCCFLTRLYGLFRFQFMQECTFQNIIGSIAICTDFCLSFCTSFASFGLCSQLANSPNCRCNCFCLFFSGMLIVPDMICLCIIHRFTFLSSPNPSKGGAERGSYYYPFVPITLSNLYSTASSLICGADAFAVVSMGYILA